jgi:hypothetical protein
VQPSGLCRKMAQSKLKLETKIIKRINFGSQIITWAM